MAALSVLMSIYNKEKPEFLIDCFESLLKQTVKADEWVIVEDGPLTKELYDILDHYQFENPGLIKRIPLACNRGLGLALREGLPNCKNELVARMDTDDIAREDRFEKQLLKFTQYPSLDICGSNIDEFENTPDNIVAHRIVPSTHEEIVKYQKRRDAFNHVTVMFKKSAVLKAGNYESCPLMEDTYLWARMIINDAQCCNIDEPLVCVRIGSEMYERRGGWDYFKKYSAGKKMVYQTGYISKFDYYLTLTIQLIVSLLPRSLRGWLFKNVLHR